MAKIKRLENLDADAITCLLGNAMLLVSAGKAIVGIDTYLTPSPTTQPTDMPDDAKRAIEETYGPNVIQAYISALSKNHLISEAKELTKRYAQLRKLARLPPVRL